MPDRNPGVADRLTRKLNLLAWLNGLLSVALVAAVVHFAGRAAQAHDALCNLRAEQARRLGTTERYLARHPEGAPRLGITRADLEAQIRNSRKTLIALDDLGCAAS